MTNKPIHDLPTALNKLADEYYRSAISSFKAVLSEHGAKVDIDAVDEAIWNLTEDLKSSAESLSLDFRSETKSALSKLQGDWPTTFPQEALEVFQARAQRVQNLIDFYSNMSQLEERQTKVVDVLKSVDIKERGVAEKLRWVARSYMTGNYEATNQDAASRDPADPARSWIRHVYANRAIGQRVKIR